MSKIKLRNTTSAFKLKDDIRISNILLSMELIQSIHVTTAELRHVRVSTCSEGCTATIPTLVQKV